MAGSFPTIDKYFPPVPKSPNEPRPQPLTEFHKFPQLPAELRHMIWRQVHVRPRIIIVDYREFADGKFQISLRQNQPPPPLFGTTTESRAIAKPYYYHLKAYYYSHETSVYVNFAIDLVVLNPDKWQPGIQDSPIPTPLHAVLTSRCVNLALCIESRIPQPFLQRYYEPLQVFSALKSVLLYMNFPAMIKRQDLTKWLYVVDMSVAIEDYMNVNVANVPFQAGWLANSKEHKSVKRARHVAFAQYRDSPQDGPQWEESEYFKVWTWVRLNAR